MTQWWQQPQRIIQTNLRLTDADMDCRQVAREVREAGATAMLFNVGGIYAWYPTALPLHAHNPFLTRDLVGEMIDACRKENVHFIGRFDLSKGTQIAYDAHPDWFCHTRDGRPFHYNGTYQASVTGEWYNQQSLHVMDEVLSRYDFDAAFFNMFGYQRASYAYEDWGFSHDPSAVEQFATFSGGLAIPGERDLADPAYRLYQQFQDETAAALSRKVYQHIKSIRPDFGMANLNGWQDFIRMEANRATMRKEEWPHQTGENARFAQSVGGGRVPYTVALTHYFDFHWRNTAENENFQLNRMAQALANGAEPHYYFMGPIGRQLDTKPVEQVQKIFAYHRTNEALYNGLQSASRVGLYQSKNTERYGRLESGKRAVPESGAAFRGAYRILLESGIPFDIVSDRIARRDGFAEALARFELLVLPDVTCLSDGEAAAIDQFVASGGNVLATGQTGFLTEFGEARPNNALQCLPFDAVTEIRDDTAAAYLLVGPNDLSFPNVQVIMLDGTYALVAPKPGTSTMFRTQPPQRFGPPELAYPETEATGDPGVILGTHGKGSVVYVPWSPERAFYKYSIVEHRQLMSQLVGRLTTAPAKLDGASRTELTIRKHRTTGELVAHVINYSGQSNTNYEKPIAQHGVRLGVLGAAGSAARTLVSGEELAASEPDAEGYRWFELPAIHHFEAIVMRSVATN